jgi:hypothetical protein
MKAVASSATAEDSARAPGLVSTKATAAIAKACDTRPVNPVKNAKIPMIFSFAIRRPGNCPVDRAVMTLTQLGVNPTPER